MKTVQFIGIEPATLIEKITTQVKDAVISELTKNQVLNDPIYLSAEKVCGKLDITKPTLHEWRKRGIIKSRKLGARVYYRWDEVQNAMIINH